MDTNAAAETISDCTAQSELTESTWNQAGRRTTSWWMVSVAFHALVIALAAVVSISIQLPTTDDAVVIVTTLSKPPEFADTQRSARVTLADVFGTEQTINGDPAPVEEKALRLTSAPVENEGLCNEGAARETPLGEHATSTIADASVTTLDTGRNGDTGGGGTGFETGDFQDMIGIGGGSTGGHGGGVGWGSGTGMGMDAGSGLGSQCVRIAYMCRFVGHIPRVSMSGVNAALRWLAKHQESDGHWDTLKFGSSQKTDTAMTGLALLAFLGSGHSEKAGEFKSNVQRAVKWLESKQQASGLIFDATDAGAHRGIGYPTAIATLALAEAAGMASVPETRAAAQNAVDYCVEHQCGAGSDKLGWRYGPQQPGDTSVTGWFVMALKSAKIAGLHVDHAAFDGALQFLKSVELQTPGEASYSPVIHYGYQPGDAHADSAHRLTAIGAVMQIFTGAKKEDVQPSVEWFMDKGGAPAWGANGNAADMYYWYYGSLAAFQVGGPTWERWEKGLIKALSENQCTQGDDAGSWPIAGAFSSEWGRVGQTALGCLSYEVYVRYPRQNTMKCECKCVRIVNGKPQ